MTLERAIAFRLRCYFGRIKNDITVSIIFSGFGWLVLCHGDWCPCRLRFTAKLATGQNLDLFGVWCLDGFSNFSGRVKLLCNLTPLNFATASPKGLTTNFGEAEDRL